MQSDNLKQMLLDQLFEQLDDIFMTKRAADVHYQIGFETMNGTNCLRVRIFIPSSEHIFSDLGYVPKD